MKSKIGEMSTEKGNSSEKLEIIKEVEEESSSDGSPPPSYSECKTNTAAQNQREQCNGGNDLELKRWS